MQTRRIRMFIVVTTFAIVGCGDGGGTHSVDTEARAVFAVIEPPNVRVYVSDLDGRHRMPLVTQRFPFRIAGARPFSLIRADVSPDGRHLAYQFPYLTPEVFVVAADGADRHREVAEADEFAFSPDGQQLLYEMPTPSGEEPPLYGPASRWFLRTLDGGETELDVGQSNANRLGGWLDDARVLLVSTSNYGGIGNRLYVLDVAKGGVGEIVVPDGIQLGDVATDHRGSDAVILLPPDFGARWTCDIFQLQGMTLRPSVVNVADTYCEGLAWNDADELWHGRGTGPNGRIDSRETTASGYYILSSVYRYRFSTGQDEPVVPTDGRTVYRFASILPGRALVVSNERIDRQPAYRLEVRDLSGKNPRLLTASAYEPLFLGWLRDH